MSEQGQQGPEDDVLEGEATAGGGRSTRGPAVRSGGEQEPGGLVPPYDGRREQATDVDEERRPPAADANVGGATGPVRADDDQLTSEEPSETPRGSKASPADEQPAADMTPTGSSDDEAVDLPTHTPGTGRGEEKESG
jgi:hypothetical protein